MGQRSLLVAVGFIHEVTKLESGSHRLKISIETKDVKEGDEWKTVYLPITLYTDKKFTAPETTEKVPFNFEIEGIMVEKKETEKGVYINTTGYLKSLAVKQKIEKKNT